MPSPFPGMDPYLESEDTWHDFHVRFVPALAEALTPLLPDRYIAKTDQDVFIRELSADERQLIGRPDVFIVPSGVPSGRQPEGLPAVADGVAGTSDTSVAAAFPPLAVDVERRPFVQIVDRRRRAVVTAIEVLSPSNKSPSGDRANYLAKRRRLQSAGTNLVELDLLRGGPRLPLDGLPRCDYYALVSRATDWPAVRVWPVGVREPLPVVPIPLAAGEADVQLDLRAAFDRVYDGAGYARYIYAADPNPLLSPDDALWATSILAR